MSTLLAKRQAIKTYLKSIGKYYTLLDIPK